MRGADPKVLGDILDHWYVESPEREAVGYIPDLKNCGVVDQLSYRELRNRALEIAHCLIGKGYTSGQRAILTFGPGIDFVEAFFACSYAGIIAVPSPAPKRAAAGIERFKSILADSAPSLVLCDSNSRPSVEKHLSSMTQEEVQCFDIDMLRGCSAGELDIVDPGDLALLQYTSGSTSDPKGVMVTHNNLINNLTTIGDNLGIVGDINILGWLPLTHDMGLIGQLLYPLSVGGRVRLIPPSEFIRHPIEWLNLISKERSPVAVAPNFAYEYCARAAGASDEEVLHKLDLSGLMVALNGAEPINTNTMDRFTEVFARVGFRRESFAPTYGLAESTLMVCAKRPGTPPLELLVDRDALERGKLVESTGVSTDQRVVSSGHFDPGSVAIVDHLTGCRLEDGSVGEIWISGPSVAKGYWQKSELSTEIFHASINGEAGSYLRTGDLGVTFGQSLFVTGRIKDLIILRGRNLYPHDIELAIAVGVDTSGFGATAVFGIENGADVIVVQEVDGAVAGELPDAAARIKVMLAEQFGIGQTTVVFVPRKTITHTTSGKIRRNAIKRLFLDSAIESIFESPARGIEGRMKEHA